NIIPKDSVYVARSYNQSMLEINNLVSENKSVIAYKILDEIAGIYKPFQKIDYLNESIKTLKRSATYKSQNRNQNAIFFKESLIKEDYDYYLEEDILTYNYNNLGWWNYQMGELKKHKQSSNTFQRQMGIRLEGYLNALIDDNIDLIRLNEPIDEESLNFLWMLKTIISPKDFDNYLKIISLNAKVEDYSTALFYLEELLKNGYKNTDELYALENTALLRITPEFNALVAKYLKESRYMIIEE
ncbi:MAG: alpha/beta hydrolase, partial [Maribacter sp.]|nr:alpha/beta hydrolase [Maribacter sp.]